MNKSGLFVWTRTEILWHLSGRWSHCIGLHCIGLHCIGHLHRALQRKQYINFRFKTSFCQDSLSCKHKTNIYKKIRTLINLCLCTTQYNSNILTNKSRLFIAIFCTEFFFIQYVVFFGRNRRK